MSIMQHDEPEQRSRPLLFVGDPFIDGFVEVEQETDDVEHGQPTPVDE